MDMKTERYEEFILTVSNSVNATEADVLRERLFALWKFVEKKELMDEALDFYGEYLDNCKLVRIMY